MGEEKHNRRMKVKNNTRTCSVAARLDRGRRRPSNMLVCLT